MFTLKCLALSNFDEANPDLHELFKIFTETLNKNLTFREFRFFFFRHRPHYMDITFLKEGDRNIGFICVSFYYHEIDQKRYTICRGVVGIHEDYRGGKLPAALLCRKYINYKLRHPFEEMYIIGFMANPILYSMICKYTHKVYPKLGIAIPATIDTLRDKLIRYYGLSKKAIAPFVLKIHFQVHLNEKDEKRIYTSRDTDIRYYLQLNPDFQKQIGVMTIVPVSWHNVLVSISKFLFIKPLKKIAKKCVIGASLKWRSESRRQRVLKILTNAGF